LKTVQELEENVPHLSIQKYTDKGHFTLGDLGTQEFPELLEALL